jgi:hypothetical protein
MNLRSGATALHEGRSQWWVFIGVSLAEMAAMAPQHVPAI